MEKTSTRLVGKDYVKNDVLENLLNQAKGDVCKEFEKVCMTDKSFLRMKKEMHNIFDNLQTELLSAWTKQ